MTRDNTGWGERCWDVMEGASSGFFHRGDRTRLLYLALPALGYLLLPAEAAFNRLGYPLNPSAFPMLFFHTAAGPLIGYKAASIIAMTLIHIPVWLAVAQVTVWLARLLQRFRTGPQGPLPGP